MDKIKSTFTPQSEQTSADTDSAGRGKTPTFHVQTGIRAGGFREAFRARRSARQGAEIR